MPIPFLLAGAAAVAGAAGLVKGAQAVANNSEAKNIISKAQKEYDDARDIFEQQKISMSEHLQHLGKLKIDVWNGEMKTFVTEFKSFKNVRMDRNININESLAHQMQNPQNMRNMEIATIKASEVAKAGIASLGAGTLAGIASYGGSMMFASASTGTAIASLSGVAATNATLAWFGGGSIASGGLGMAGGTVVLGGIVVGPVLAVGGFIMAAKSEENLAEARKTYAEAQVAIEKMKIMTDLMSRVSYVADNYSIFISHFREKFKEILDELILIRQRAIQSQIQSKRNFFSKLFGNKSKIDFNALTMREKQTLHISWLMAQVLYSVLSAPLLTQSGNLDEKAQKVLSDANDSIPQITQMQKELEQLPKDVLTIVPAHQNGDDLRPKSWQENYTTRRNNLQYQTRFSAISDVLWKFLGNVMNIVNWLFGITYFIEGYIMFRENLGVAIGYFLSALVFCPLVAKKKEFNERDKLRNKLRRFGIGFGILIITMIIFL